MEARLSLSACQRAQAGLIRHLGQTYLTGMIPHRQIGLEARAHPGAVAERPAPAAVSRERSCIRLTPSQTTAAHRRALRSALTLQPEVLVTSRVLHISA